MLLILLIRTLGIDLKNFGFQEDKEFMEISEADREEVEVNILGIIIIPYKIAICIIKTDILCDNEFPHITLSIVNYKPKDSNDILEILFGKNGKYKDLYYNIINGNDVDIIINDCINIFGHDENVYIKLKNYGFSLIGFQKGFY